MPARSAAAIASLHEEPTRSELHASTAGHTRLSDCWLRRGTAGHITYLGRIQSTSAQPNAGCSRRHIARTQRGRERTHNARHQQASMKAHGPHAQNTRLESWQEYLACSAPYSPVRMKPALNPNLRRSDKNVATRFTRAHPAALGIGYAPPSPDYVVGFSKGALEKSLSLLFLSIMRE